MMKNFFSPLTLKRIKKFKSFKRGWYSLIIIASAYFLCLFAEFYINQNPLLVRYNENYYFTAYNMVSLRQAVFSDLSKAHKAYEDYKNEIDEPARAQNQKLDKLSKNYENAFALRLALKNGRLLKEEFEKQKTDGFVLTALYPYGPNEILLDEINAQPPSAPTLKNFFGTDDRGRDVFARMVYGFRISVTFALTLTASSYAIGIFIGALLGYYGGKIDFFGLRLIEIWSAVPFLYTVMIISSMVIPTFPLLVIILCVFGWMGMSFYVRGEVLREKQKDYVQAAVAVGASDIKIILKHIMPNSLTPAIAFLPFSIVGGISALVSLDFLGFGLPEPTPSWGQMLGVGVTNLNSWWLTAAPVASVFITLILITFVGEAVREALDPREYARLR